MKKLLLYSIRILAAILLVLLLAVAGLWIYVSTHKATLLNRVRTEINSRLSGEVSFDDIQVHFFHSFPDLSVSLTNVRVRDSLWQQHHHTLFQGKLAYVKLSFLPLFTGKVSLLKVSVDNGAIYLFSDSTGYSNTHLFRARPKTRKTVPENIPDVELKNTRVDVDLEEKNKLFSFTADYLLCEVSGGDKSFAVDVSLSARIHSLAFNRNKGGFAENTPVAGKFRLHFNPLSQVLQFEKIGLSIDQHPFLVSGKFFLGAKPVPFILTFQTARIPFQEAVALVSKNIREKLGMFSLGEVTALTARLDGTDPDQREPQIRISLQVSHDSLGTPVAQFGNTSFAGYFTNEWKPGTGRGDENSLLRFTSFVANWQHIPLFADTITVTNLLHPIISCNLQSTLPLTLTNDLFENRDVQFTGGSGRVKINYRGPLSEKDSGLAAKTLNGYLSLDSASLLYSPRNFQLSGCQGRFDFSGEDLLINDMKAQAGTTALNLNGSVRNIFSLLHKGQQRPVLECTVITSRLNLNDFTVFLKKKSVRPGVPAGRPRQAGSGGPVVTEVFDALSDHDAIIKLSAKQLVYRKFSATNLSARIGLQGEEINLNQVALEHGGGSFQVRGLVVNGPSGNPVRLQASLHRVDIATLFANFDNFGQQAILDKNLKGKLDAAIQLSGMITDKASVVPNSMQGNIDFTLNDGALTNYPPVEKVGNYVFKNRDFSNIQFASLQDKWELHGSLLRINRMVIRSTVLTLAVQGTYDFREGPDLSLAVPVSNIKDPKENASLYNKGVQDNMGLSIHLRARPGEDGKLKLTWDPFQKATKKIKKTAR